MASFEKKLNSFLLSAVEHKVVGQSTVDKLLNYSRSDEYNHKGWFSLSSSVVMMGALALCIGVILIISTNWHLLSDLVKISGFLTLLVGSHLAGIYFDGRGISKTSSALHFLGAGLFIAGVGLIAQMFNLYSQTGISYLIWFVMIFPLALILQSSSIFLLSIFAFAIWGNTYIFYLKDTISAFSFNAFGLLGLVLLGEYLKQKGSFLANYAQGLAVSISLAAFYALGFFHNFGGGRGGYGNMNELDDLTFFVIFPALFLLFIILSLIWLWRKISETEKIGLATLIAAGLVTSFLILAAMSLNWGHDLYYERFNFGWNKKVYLWPMLISVSAWISYFFMVIYGVVMGAFKHQPWLLNASMLLLGVGIFTRFIDLVGSMLDTGIMFIVCGVFLFVLGYGLERWRKRLIKGNQTGKGV